jgi:hypothetical protein
MSLDSKWLEIVEGYYEIEACIRKITLMKPSHENKEIARGLKDYIVYLMARVIFTDSYVKVNPPENLKSFYSSFPEEGKKIQKFISKLLEYGSTYAKVV